MTESEKRNDYWERQSKKNVKKEINNIDKDENKNKK